MAVVIFPVNGSGLGEISCQLNFVDQGSGPGLTQVNLGTLSGFGSSGDPYCNGNNNTTLSVFIQGSDLQMAKGGYYNDTFMILVEPQ